jgi:hypothetical protein
MIKKSFFLHFLQTKTAKEGQYPLWLFILYVVFKKSTIMTKQQIYKIVATAVTALLTCLAIALGLSSCNVTRTITTQSQYYQRGDTTCTIVTKTIETYDASKKL